MILVVSPHFDDAALSCAEHIRSWRATGHEVTVATLFSEFGSDPASSFMAPFLRAKNFRSVPEYEVARREEDVRAMKLMGVSYKWLGLCDAGFRQRQGRAAYSNRQELTSGKLGPEETHIVDEARQRLAAIAAPDFMVAPMGIGGHVDHLVARTACQKLASSGPPLAYYADFPYARNPLNFTLSVCKLVKGLRISARRMTQWKREVLAQYQSQMSFLFRGRPYYPEVLFLPREMRGAVHSPRQEKALP
jgi:LmbE family N-acetylglucosaminyl deacetylase